MSHKLFRLIAKIMDEDILKINYNSSPETIENWDSFNGYVLLDELESEFKVKFSIEEVTNVKTVADIKRHLENHGVKLDEQA
jgi:acyl carrier protein